MFALPVIAEAGAAGEQPAGISRRPEDERWERAARRNGNQPVEDAGADIGVIVVDSLGRKSRRVHSTKNRALPSN